MYLITLPYVNCSILIKGIVFGIHNNIMNCDWEGEGRGEGGVQAHQGHRQGVCIISLSS